MRGGYLSVLDKFRDLICCPKCPGGMDLQLLSLLELPGDPGRTG